MTNNDDFASRRSQRRRTVTGIVNVINQRDETLLGRLVNITSEGLMLVSSQPLATDTLYQVILALPEEVDGVRQVELGMDCLWTSPTDPKADMFWSGCHIIDISETMLQHLLVLIEQFSE